MPLSVNILCKSACVGHEESRWADVKGMQIIVLNKLVEKNAVVEECECI